jgi:hypothetical protein
LISLSIEGLGIGLIDEDEVGLRGPPGPRSGGLRPEDLPAGALRLGPDRIPSSRSGSRSRYRKTVSYVISQIPTVPIRLSDTLQP